MKSILLVDGETVISAELQRTLQRFKFRVETAGTLQKALCVIQRSQIDGVLLEFNLESECGVHPRTGAGLELVRQLRARGMRMPVLIFTAMEGALYEQASLEAGADDFILKTDGIPHLLKRLHAHIHGREKKGPRRWPSNH